MYADDEEKEGISPTLHDKIRTLPKEIQEEVKEEIGKGDPIDTVIKQKREIAEIKRVSEEQEKQPKIVTDREKAFQLRDKIIETQNQFNRLMSNVRWASKKKFFFEKPKQRDDFVKFLEGASGRARKWADELDSLRENIEIEIIKE